MKNMALALFLFYAPLSFTYLIAQHYSISPAKPKAGESIAIQYNPSGTALQDAEAIYAVAFFLEDGEPIAKDIEMVLRNNEYTGHVRPSPQCKAFFVSFFGEENQVDNRDGEGYYSAIYDRKGSQVLGARANLALVYASSGSFFGVQKDREKAMAFMKKEFEQHPNTKENTLYFDHYARLAKQTSDEAAMAEVYTRIETLSNAPTTEQNLWTAYSLARILNTTEQSERLAQRMKKEYPQGIFIKDELANRFYREMDNNKREQLLLEYQKIATQEDQQSIAYFASIVAQGYALNNWSKFETYIDLVTAPRARAKIYHAAAWTIAGQSQQLRAQELNKALQLSRQSLELLDEAEKDPLDKPASYGDQSWQEARKKTYGKYADLYALLQYQKGQYEEALQYQEAYIEAYGYSDPEANTRYVSYLEKAKGPQAAMAAMENMITHNLATAGLTERYKNLFAKTLTTQQAAERYLSELEEEALEEVRIALKKEMIDLPAPAFQLLNLKGESVRLSDYQGKVVVLDFWATWCAPCKASFRGMQEAVEQHRNEEGVAFLFINSWEQAKDKVAKAGEFMAIYEYPFQVLMDQENKVVESYQVESIPTKFILDPKGRIRFKKTGFSGDNGQLVEELNAMIDLAGESGNKERPATFMAND